MNDHRKARYLYQGSCAGCGQPRGASVHFSWCMAIDNEAVRRANETWSPYPEPPSGALVPPGSS